MARRRSWAAQQEADRRRAQQEAERQRREMERQAKADARQRQQLHHERRAAEAQQLNEKLGERIETLEQILSTGLHRRAVFDFSSIKDTTPFPSFEPPLHLANPVPVPQLRDFVPPPPRGLQRLFGKRKYEEAVAAGKEAFDRACTERAEAERQRLGALEQRTAQNESQRREHEARQARQHQQVDLFQQSYRAGDSGAIASYCEAVLSGSPYPEGFPSEFRLAYTPDSKQLVVEYELPPFDVIPEPLAYKYVKAQDEITRTKRKIGERRGLYADVIAAVALRTLHELYAADVAGHLDVIVFNGYVDTIDSGTGQPIQPHLITVRASRDLMHEVDLERVAPQACLQHLKAEVSPSPDSLSPVRPIVDFNMVDPRFVEYGDVLSTLDDRPNLMELSPSEFETMVTNLFAKMGLETKLTQPSRDGGVDCVAYDQRPILGGKVVIQAKRYKNTVGVSAVRDLYGTMANERANKGILVTTSGFGRAAYDFANGKPIELITGGNLLYLLDEQGIKAKIEIPEDWEDPSPAS